MSFKDLMDAWSARREPQKTRQDYAVNLPLNDASQIGRASCRERV